MGDKEQHKRRQKRWYAYVHGDPLNSENYQLATVQSNCWSGKEICAIYADGYDDEPFEFSNKLKTHIANALVSGFPQPASGDPYIVVLKL